MNMLADTVTMTLDQQLDALPGWAAALFALGGTLCVCLALGLLYGIARSLKELFRGSRWSREFLEAADVDDPEDMLGIPNPGVSPAAFGKRLRALLDKKASSTSDDKKGKDNSAPSVTPSANVASAPNVQTMLKVLDGASTQLKDQLSQALKERNEARRELAATKDALDFERDRAARLSKVRLQDWRDRLAKQEQGTRAMKELKNKLASARQEIKTLRENLKVLPTDFCELVCAKDTLAAARVKCGKLMEENERLRDSLESARREWSFQEKVAENRANEARQEKDAAEQELTRLRGLLARAEERQRKALVSKDSRIDRLASEIVRLSGDNQQLRDRAKKAEELKAKLAKRVAQLKTELFASWYGASQTCSGD